MDLKEMEGGGLAGWEGWGCVPPVRKLRIVARLLFFRPLKRAGDVLALWRPQSRDWGYPMPPADAG